MTEYKKCAALCDDLFAIGAALADEASAAAAIEAAKAQLDRGDGIVDSLVPRVDKLLLRARETNADLAYYNEAMCGKIEVLAVRFEEARAAFDATTPFVDDAYRVHLEARAATAEWRAQLATSFEGVGAREAEERQLLRYAARREWDPLAAAAALEKAEIRRVELERAEALWRAETARRNAEKASFQAVVADAAAAPAAAALSALTDIRAAYAGETDGVAAARLAVRRLHGLVDEILSRPENDGVRQLRNNHAVLSEHFGHPCARYADGRAALPVAARRYGATERLLALIGFRAAYTQTTVLLPAADLSDAAGAALVMPCGGWEAYGERQLTLREPAAFEEPDAWCDWRDRVEAIRDLLATEMR
jgi:hypothetical protein